MIKIIPFRYENGKTVCKDNFIFLVKKIILSINLKYFNYLCDQKSTHNHGYIYIMHSICAHNPGI